MNYKISGVALILSSLVIAGCASRASSIAPIAIPSANYKGLSCDETKTSLEQKRATQNALVKQQNNAATGDAVGVFFVLLPVGSIFGADKEGELAQAKGEVLALESAVSINCNVASTPVKAASPSLAATSTKPIESSLTADRLKELDSLLKQKLITKVEYDLQRKEILESL